MCHPPRLGLFMALLLLSLSTVGLVHCGNKTGSIPATVKAAKY